MTLKKPNDTHDDLETCQDTIADLQRQLIERTDLRDDLTKTGNQLVIRCRKGALAFFGPDSTQYAQTGGKRSSEHKPRSRKNKTVPLNKVA